MSAPKFKLKTNELTLPIGKRKVAYRPWTMGEEKELLLARQSDNVKMFSLAIGEVVKACTGGKVDSKKDSNVDVLFTYMMIRARSDDQNTRLAIGCGCEEGATVMAHVDLSDVKTEVPEGDTIIELGEDEVGEMLYIELKNISFYDFVHADEATDSDVFILKSCTTRLFTDEGDRDIASMSDEDWQDFYNGMPKPAFRKILDFFNKPPRAWIVATGKCEKCGKEIKREIEGVANFT